MSPATEVEAVATVPAGRQRFFNDQDSSYVLPADSEERIRLDNQHHHLRAAAKGTLVFAPIALQDGDRVLDCATGTGIWALELAAQSPSGVSLQGIDISSHLFPSPTQLSSNVSFTCESILTLPPSLDNVFALVHQRLLIGAFRAAEWPNVLRALYRVTKPGGWVQLCEVRPRGMFDQRSDMPATKQLIETYQQKLYAARGLDIDCALHLEGWVKDAGFVNPGRTVRTLAMGPVDANADNTLPAYDNTRYYTATAAPTVRCGAAANEEEYLAVVEAAGREWGEVEDATIPFHWVWAQKPDGTEGQRA